jgi:hypothetical protein
MTTILGDPHLPPFLPSSSPARDDPNRYEQVANSIFVAGGTSIKNSEGTTN